jgi:hypothetical protein
MQVLAQGQPAGSWQLASFTFKPNYFTNFMIISLKFIKIRDLLPFLKCVKTEFLNYENNIVANLVTRL